MQIDLGGASLPHAGPRAARQPRMPIQGVPVKTIGFVGDSGAGKTTLVEQLITRFAQRGLRVAAIKHAHHGFDMDRPGKDSYRFREAGARQVLLASDQRWVLMSEDAQGEAAGALAGHIARLDPCDLVVVEGYRGQAGIPFVEVRRAGMAAGLAGHVSARAPRPTPAGRVAIASDVPVPPTEADRGLPVLDLNDIDGISRFIIAHLELPSC